MRVEASQGEGLRRWQIPRAMLVVDGERPAGLASHLWRTGRKLEQLTPMRGGLVISAAMPGQERQRPQSGYFDRLGADR